MTKMKCGGCGGDYYTTTEQCDTYECKWTQYDGEQKEIDETYEEIKKNAQCVEESQSFRMLKEALAFINSIGKQNDFLDYAPEADRNLYYSVWN